MPELGTTLMTSISPDHGNALDINAVIEVAEYFGLGRDEADAMLAMAMRIRDEWRGIGMRLGMTSSDFRTVASASDNMQVERAIAMAATKVPGGTGT